MTFAAWLAEQFTRAPGRLTPPKKADVAEAIGVAPARISEWLRGATPDARFLSPLADVLGLDAEGRVAMLATLAHDEPTSPEAA